MTFLNRFSLSAIFLMAYLALGTSNASAALVYGHNNLSCYDSITYNTYPLSDCANSGNATATTAAAIILQATTTPEPPAPKVEVRTTTTCGASSMCFTTTETVTTAADGTQTTKTETCTYDSSYESHCGISPAEGDLTVQNLSGQVSHTQTNIAAASSLKNTEQKMKVSGIALNYSRDIGDWSYAIALPIRRTDNNNTYAALDNTQIGLVLTPTYHLFLEQVHGLSVNLGGVLGYTHTDFSDVAALRASPYSLTGFSNLDTTFGGLNASLAKQLSAFVRLNLSVNAMTYHNEGGGTAMGKNGSIVNSTAGLNFSLTDKVSAGAKFNAIRLHQSSFNSTSSFHSLGGNLRYTIDRRSSLTGSFDTTVGSENLDSQTYMLNYQLEM